MPYLLHLDSSIQTEGSVTRQMSAATVARLKQTAPGLEVAYRDLAVAPLPHLSAPVFAANSAGVAVLTADQQTDVAESRAVLDEFLRADIVIIGAPLYNYSIPSQLKAWIDRIVIAGKTFRYGGDGPVGLVGGKRVIVLVARGGMFGPGSANEQNEHAASYLRAIFALVGVEHVEVIAAEGLAIGPEQQKAAINRAMDRISGLAA